MKKSIAFIGIVVVLGLIHFTDAQNCKQTGCAPGLCCSEFGWCGNTPEHCKGSSSGGGGGGGGGGGYTSGEASYYYPDPSPGAYGSCGWQNTRRELVVATNAAVRQCGKTIEVKGPKGTVRVKVVDTCPSCGGSKLDLSEAAFKAVNGGSLSEGIIKIQWKYV